MLRVNSLIVCGESTSGCVRASTVDAFSYGFHNVVVEECTDPHHKYADVLHIDQVLTDLEGPAVKRKVA
jgi:nicotinamidase-related amidase